MLDMQIPIEMTLPGGSSTLIALVSGASGISGIGQPGNDHFTYSRSEPHLEEQHQVASTVHHSFTEVIANGTGYSDFVVILVLALCVRWILRWPISEFLARYRTVGCRGFPKRC